MEFKLPFGLVAGAFQVIFLVLFAIFADYDPAASGSNKAIISTHGGNESHGESSLFDGLYPMFQDVHVMMFVGFGFLMTFLRRYGFSSVGFNMLITVFVMQWALLVGGFFSFVHHHQSRFYIDILGLLNADFAAATVLITFGAVLGKTSPVQMLFISFIEIAAFKSNEFIGLDILKVTDVGGSMFVHVFGAYFGLALARVLYDKAANEHGNESSIYHSDIFAMIGTLFLWMYWPSFNAALVSGDRRHRAVINTYLSLAACCLTTFALSSVVNKNKFDMVHIQNATLAGGVAVGTSADLMLYPAGAITVGIVSGSLSVLGFKYLKPWLTAKFNVHDTCGVHNLHGMPGVMAGIVGAIMAAVAQESQYHYSLYEIFPLRAPKAGRELDAIQAELPAVEPGKGRTAGVQAGYQILALAITLAVSLVTGALTGLLVKWGVFGPPEKDYLYDDSLWWETPEDYPKGHAAQAFPGYAGSESTEPRRGSIMALTANNEVEPEPTLTKRM